jgi:hypothetical protein
MNDRRLGLEAGHEERTSAASRMLRGVDFMSIIAGRPNKGLKRTSAASQAAAALAA